MLYYVSGPVAVLEPGLAVIDCNGVGYGCRVTAYTAAQLKLNQQAKLYITESIREDAFDLYGFISREEQRCYELLTTVNGVGPKAAMSILSAGPQNFTLAVMTGDEKLLTAAQGVGKKIAQRIILELKDKLNLQDAFEQKLANQKQQQEVVKGNDSHIQDAVQALVALGYPSADALRSVKRVENSAELSVEDLLKAALKKMI